MEKKVLKSHIVTLRSPELNFWLGYLTLCLDQSGGKFIQLFRPLNTKKYEDSSTTTRRS